MRSTVVILILNWNGWEDTLECLESVFRTSGPEREVVVIDNGSENGSIERIREWAAGMRPARTPDPIAKPVTVTCYDKETAERGGAPGRERERPGLGAHNLVLIQSGANRGFAGGNNVGIRYALARGADYVLLLNNDAFFRSPDELSRMVEFMDRTPGAGACGGRMFFPDNRPQQSYGNFPTLSRVVASLFPVYRLLPGGWLRGMKRSCVVPDGSVSEPMSIDWPSGACLLARRSAIEDVGLLDERYFLYLEETDWCYRMQAKGWRRYYLPQVAVTHVFGGSVNSTSTPMKRYHLDSQFIYFRKHFSPLAVMTAAAAYLVRSSLSLLAWTAGGAALPARRREETLRNREYWRAALKLSIATLRDGVSGGATAVCGAARTGCTEGARRA